MTTLPYTATMSSLEHQKQANAAAGREPVGCAVLTISDSRTLADDRGGAMIIDFLNSPFFTILDRQIVKDDAAAIDAQLRRWLPDSRISAILCTGGTGIAKRDTTIEIVRRFFTTELEGFGELFRMLSWEQVKSAAMMSRAAAGLVIQSSEQGGDTFIFAMPGSPNAVETAMKNLIVPQLPHLAWERRKQGVQMSCRQG